jgi:hypothetical protein
MFGVPPLISVWRSELSGLSAAFEFIAFLPRRCSPAIDPAGKVLKKSAAGGLLARLTPVIGQ